MGWGPGNWSASVSQPDPNQNCLAGSEPVGLKRWPTTIGKENRPCRARDTTRRIRSAAGPGSQEAPDPLWPRRVVQSDRALHVIRLGADPAPGRTRPGTGGAYMNAEGARRAWISLGHQTLKTERKDAKQKRQQRIHRRQVLAPPSIHRPAPSLLPGVSHAILLIPCPCAHRAILLVCFGCRLPGSSL